jgi:cation transport ATPase
MRRRFWISLAFTVPLLVLMFVRVGGAVRSWVDLALATPVVRGAAGHSSSGVWHQL